MQIGIEQKNYAMINMWCASITVFIFSNVYIYQNKFIAEVLEFLDAQNTFFKVYV